MTINGLGDSGKDKVIQFQKGVFTNPINLIVRASEDRSIGKFMKDAFAAYVLEAEKLQNYESLGNTFRDEDLDAALREHPGLYAQYQARINELIADPTKAEYGVTKPREQDEPDSAEPSLDYITGEALVQMFQSDLTAILGLETLPFVSTPTGRIYGLFPSIAPDRNKFKLRFNAQDDSELACYSIDEMFKVKDNIREFVDTYNVVSVSLLSGIVFDDSLITNDRVVMDIRKQVAESAQKKFRDYIVND